MTIRLLSSGLRHAVLRDAWSALRRATGRRRRRPAALLVEVLAPGDATVGPGAVENLLAALALAPGCALEIAGGGEAGPRFLARAPDATTGAHLLRQLVAHYPQAEVHVLDPAAPDPAALCPDEEATASELRLRTGAHLPLRTYRDADAREGADPLLGVLGVLADLPAGLRVLWQLALWPADPQWGRDLAAGAVAPRPARPTPAQAGGEGESALPLVLLGAAGAAGYKGYLLYAHHALLPLALLAGGAAGAVGGGLWLAARLRPAPPPDPLLVREKVAHRGVLCRLRLLAAGGTAPERAAVLDRLVAAHGAYDLPAGNALVARPCRATTLVRPTPGHSLPLGRPRPLLNAREVASLWHLPAAAAEVPGLQRAGPRRILAAHPALRPAGAGGPGPGSGGLRLGRSAAQDRVVDLLLPAGALHATALVCGKTGMGKSTVLQHLAREVLADPARTLVLFDPHSTLAAAVRGLLPPTRAAAARALCLGETEHPVGINLLDAHAGRTAPQIVGGLLTGFRYLWGDSWGHRMESVLRKVLLTLLEANSQLPPGEQYTILEVTPFLTVPPFRGEVLRLVRDRDLRSYWLDLYAQLHPRFRDEMITPVTSKMLRFEDPLPRTIVGQRATTLSVGALLDAQAPLLVDTAAAEVGADTAALLTVTLLDLLACALRERGAAGAGRVVIMVDEYQDIPADWRAHFGGLRKFGASFVVATQSLAALEETRRGLRATTFANLASLVCFQQGAEDARYLRPELDEVVSVRDLVNLPAHHAYLKTTDGAVRLPVTSLEVLPPPEGDPRVAAEVLAQTIRACGRPRLQVEAERAAFKDRLYPAPGRQQAPGAAAGARQAPPGAPTHQGGSPPPGGGGTGRSRGRRGKGGRRRTAPPPVALPGISGGSGHP